MFADYLTNWNTDGLYQILPKESKITPKRGRGYSLVTSAQFTHVGAKCTLLFACAGL